MLMRVLLSCQLLSCLTYHIFLPHLTLCTHHNFTTEHGERDRETLIEQTKMERDRERQRQGERETERGREGGSDMLLILVLIGVKYVGKTCLNNISTFYTNKKCSHITAHMLV